MNDQQMDWARRKDREVAWAKLVKRNLQLHRKVRFYWFWFWVAVLVGYAQILMRVML